MQINTLSEYINVMDQYNDLIESYDPVNEELIKELIEAMNEYDLKYRDGNPPPEILANALQDRIHVNLPETRAAKTVRNIKK